MSAVAKNWSNAECMEYLNQWRVELDAQRADLDKGEQDYKTCKAQFLAERVGIIDVKGLAAQLEGAYSTDRYRNGWAGCVRMLVKRGYTAPQIEAIIRSKWTRWAADASASRYGHATGADLARFLDKDQGATMEAVDQMVAESGLG